MSKFQVGDVVTAVAGLVVPMIGEVVVVYPPGEVGLPYDVRDIVTGDIFAFAEDELAD